MSRPLGHRRTVAILALLLGASLSSPARGQADGQAAAPASEMDPPPAPTPPERLPTPPPLPPHAPPPIEEKLDPHVHVRRAAIAGAVIFGAGYLLSAGLGAILIAWSGSSDPSCDGCPDARMMFVPVAGPFVFVSQRSHWDAGADLPVCIIGIVQLAGIGTLLAALLRVAYLKTVGSGDSPAPAPVAVGLSPDGVPQLSLRF
jgi:hypothetical protein